MVRKWHLWLGLTAGAITFLVCLSGSLFVFHEEINSYVNRDVIRISGHYNSARLPVDQILKKLKVSQPDLRLFTYSRYSDLSKTDRIMAMDPAEGEFMGLTLVYINPYNAEVLKVNNTYGYFRLIAQFHNSLMLGIAGKYLVAVSVLIFMLQLLGGLILWFPKKWTSVSRKASFSIKINGTGKRLNRDLHNVAGFYSVPLNLLLAITGLLIFLSQAGGRPQRTKKGKERPAPSASVSNISLQTAFDQVAQQYPEATLISAFIPTPGSPVYNLTALQNQDMITYQGKAVFIDAVAGTPAGHMEKMEQMAISKNNLRKLHIGSWGGTWSKMLMFVTGLIGASLPVTGLIIWLSKKK